MAKYIDIVLYETLRKTCIWEVISKSSGVLLGDIKWNPGWRRYCFYPRSDLVFSSGCLEDIKVFIDKEMKKRSD